MKHHYIFAPILISQISFAAATLPENSLEERPTITSVKPAEEKKHVVAIKSYRHAYGGALRINVLTGSRNDPAYHYRSPAHAADIHIVGSPFPKDLLDKVLASRVISGPFTISADHIISDVRSHWYDAHGQVEITYR